MIIQHNISALNSHRTMGINNSNTSKNLEKLSSGFKINRAGDDAAGLAISEKMRGQIRGLEMAEQNTNNAVSLIQTAEGGLNETHAILQRMRELAVQSSNGTFDETVDRAQLNKEFQAIKEEIDRISTATHYNGIKLLSGNLSSKLLANVDTDVAGVYQGITFATGANAPADGDALTFGGTVGLASTDANAVKATVTYNVTDLAADLDSSYSANGALVFEIAGKTYTTAAIDTSSDSDQTISTAIAAAIGSDYDTSVDGSGNLTITAKTAGAGAAPEITFKTINGNAVANATPSGTVNKTAGSDAVVAGDVTITGDNGETVAIDKKKGTATLTDANGNALTVDLAKVAKVGDGNSFSIDLTVGTGKPLTFQIGANGGQDQRVTLNVDDMSSKNIGLKAGDTKSDGSIAASDAMLVNATIDTQDNANAAIEAITAATNQVSSTRADLGALQNRMEHTLNNLGVTKENLTAAESSIRDVDMAKEMMYFTKNQILVQASQAMLAQSNQLPQGVLQLLR